MSYVVMARKYRPQTFEDMVGQEHIVRTVKNAIQANRISHAYLFTGPRGVGKTTSARLLAKAVNCLSPVDGEPCNHCVRCEEVMNSGTPDVIEIDAASNGLVDDARELREKVRYAPLTCRYKVMIIDEVHMMSNAAFNALLKTLEEPPAHSIFILATTESHKVPATIVSRCQRFDFRRIPEKQIVERLALMASSESIDVAEEALHVIARGADGGLRDAQSLFDQIVSFSGKSITTEDVVTVLGLVNTQVFIDLVDAVKQNQPANALSLIEQLVNNGADIRLFMKDWVEYWRGLVITKVVGDKAGTLLNQSGSVMEAIKRQAQQFDMEDLIGLAKLAATTDDDLRRSQHPRTMLELFLMRICSAENVASLEALWHQLNGLETKIAGLPDKPFPITNQVNEAAVAPTVAPASEATAAPVSDEAPTPEDVADVFQENTQTVAEVTPVKEETPVQPASPPVMETPAQQTPVASGPSEAGAPALVVDSLEEVEPQTYKEYIVSLWPEIMQKVGDINRRAQALLRDVTVADAEDGWVLLNCASDYHKTGLEKEEPRKVIESVLEDVLERNTRMRLQVEGEGDTPQEAGEDDASAREKEFADIARTEPLVQKTLDMFGGKIVDVIQNQSGGTK